MTSEKFEGCDLPHGLAGAGDCYYIPVAATPSMVTIEPADPLAQLMGKPNGLSTGFQVGRER
jgi:hypothetical protein